MKSHKTAARVFGIFFLMAFLSYGLGSGLIESIVNVPDFLSGGLVRIVLLHCDPPPAQASKRAHRDGFCPG